MESYISFSKNLITDDEITNVHSTRFLLKHNPKRAKCFLICMPFNEKDQLDIISSSELFSYKRNNIRVKVCALCKSFENALKIIENAASVCYSDDSTLSLKEYMSWQ